MDAGQARTRDAVYADDVWAALGDGDAHDAFERQESVSIPFERGERARDEGERREARRDDRLGDRMETVWITEEEAAPQECRLG